MTKESYQILINMTRIRNIALKKAQEENRKMGLPNVYGKNKRLYFELPDSTITMEKPDIFLKMAKII